MQVNIRKKIWWYFWGFKRQLGLFYSKRSWITVVWVPVKVLICGTNTIKSINESRQGSLLGSYSGAAMSTSNQSQGESQEIKTQTCNQKVPQEGTIDVCRGSSPRTFNPKQGCWAQKSRQAKRITQTNHNNWWWVIQLQVNVSQLRSSESRVGHISWYSLSL